MNYSPSSDWLSCLVITAPAPVAAPAIAPQTPAAPVKKYYGFKSTTDKNMSSNQKQFLSNCQAK